LESQWRCRNYRLNAPTIFGISRDNPGSGIALSCGTATFAAEGIRAGEQAYFDDPRLASHRCSTVAPPSESQALFAKGQAAAAKRDLDAAEAAFRKVIAIARRRAPHTSNLGVIAMRRKEVGPGDHAVAKG